MKTQFYGIYVGTGYFDNLCYGTTGMLTKNSTGVGWMFKPDGNDFEYFVSESEIYNPDDEPLKHFVPLSLEKRKKLLHNFLYPNSKFEGHGTERECDFYNIPKYEQV